MPAIRQYNAPALSLDPTETGIRATAEAGRRAGASYNEVAQASEAVGQAFARNLGGAIRAAGDQVVAYAEHREIAHGAAAWAGLNDRLTQQWNDIAKNADPNDPTVAQRFREGVMEGELEKFRDSFLTEGGQRFAESHVERLRNHMFEKTAADMTSLAAKAVSVNVHTTANKLSNTAMTDPSAVPHLLSSVDGMVGDMVGSAPNLKGADSAKARLELTQKMKEDIVKFGAMGAIQRSADPEATAEAWGKKYPEYINGADLKALSGNARQQIRAARQDKAYSDHIAKVEAQDRSDARETEYLQGLYSDDTKQQSQVSTKAIVNDPALTRTAKERLINVVKRELKPETEAQVSNQNYTGILADIRSGKINDVSDIYDARIAGKLNRADFNQALKDFTDYRSPEGQRVGQAEEQFLQAVGPLIDKSNPLMGKIDQDGKLNTYRLRMDIKAKIEAYRAAGKDWRDLFNPSKPDFMGKPEALAPYQKSLSQSLQDQARRLRGDTNLTGPGKTITGVEVTPVPPPPARNAGESPAEYLRRIGRQ